jgi:hypothetical protein
MMSGAYGPKSRFPPELVSEVRGMMDSGAFSDPPERRLTPEQSLERQLAWERNATRLWGAPWQAESFVSYDLLIDEKWTGGRRRKERWSVAEADRAVKVTVEAAAYLASQREALSPRSLVLAAQGVDGVQYAECISGVLAHSTPADTIGLGGWCILGRWTSWLPTFWDAMRQSLPLIADAGVKTVHIFGVLYRPALGGLLWLADQYGLSVSTDSSAPILQTTWKDQKKAGSLAPTWEENVAAYKQRLATLRQSPYYCEPKESERVLFLGA